MIVLTVKTLDSQNHTFTVDDDITVEDFKVKIADTVNIPAETQRIIYCGRVLQDSAKLSEYDVNGKVVHLVQRAPPSQNPPTTRSASPSPQPPRRGFRGFDTENTMYLGSMAFPSNLMESQGIVPPPPTHSLAGSRLNVARRMLRRAEAVITLLENPSARPSEPPSTEDQQEEEVTPIIEARVIVPPGSNETNNEAMVLRALRLLDAASGPMSSEAENSGAQANSDATPPGERAEEPPAPAETAEEPRNGGGVSGRSLAENAFRTSELAELLTTLNQLQTRFQPLLEWYRRFMEEDPVVPLDNVRETQTTLTRVSEVLHFLGHAYHSLSDIIVRARIPPPRPLLCRPILIQHSAVVQAGIPIQVEVAQFNLSADRSTSATTTTTTTETTTTTAGDSNTTRTTQAQPTMNFRGIPFIPGASMRVQSFPIEVRTAAARPVNVTARVPPPNNNNNNVNATTAAPTSTSTPVTTESSGGFNFPAGVNNSSVEFFMEVTPEVLQGTLQGPPPEFLHSLVQMAGQIMHRITPPTTTTTTGTAATTSSTSDSTSQSAPHQSTTTSARGHAQTNSTTSTSTRSTPRPHVHLAQQAMQGGFDPFLPCNSHHVTHRRRGQEAATANRQQAAAAAAPPPPQQPQRTEAEGEERQQRPTNQLTPNVFSTLRSAFTALSQLQGRSGGEEAGSSAGRGGVADLFNAFRSSLQAPTIAEALHLDESQEGQGESIINDFLVLLSRNLTIIDMMTLNTGNFDRLNQISNQIQAFFNNRILGGANTPEAVDSGVARLITEMQPFFQSFSRLRVRDDIDIVRSMERLFSRRLPEIISTATNPNATNNMRTMVEQCLGLARNMCALALHSSVNGLQGVEETFRTIIASYMQGLPEELQNLTMVTSCANLRQFMTNMGVSETEIEPYLVRNGGDLQMATSPEPETETKTEEPMELDEAAGNAVPDLPPLSLGDEAEPLPNIVLGAEPWHGQVPEDWVPIITRDVQRQRRQSTQAPFSDAYLSGMPTKRRKIVNSTKPQGTLPQVIAESVRRAVTATGLANVAPLEVVSQGAGQSPDVQSAYRSLLRTTVQAALRDNADFTPERFPNASSYFKTQ